MGQDITLSGSDGDFSAYLTEPPGGSTGKAIVVIQEIFGVNQVMRDICDDLATAGFSALCPDLFWRQEPGIQITDQTEEEWKKAFELFGGFKADPGIKDIQSAIDYLRQNNQVKVGAVGYCLGGMLAYLTSCRTDIDCSVGFYGVNIANMLDEATGIKAPLMLHIATEDEFVDAEQQQKVHGTLDSNAHVTLHDYQGNDHAFARIGGAHYDRPAAHLANQRTIDFFSTNLV